MKKSSKQSGLDEGGGGGGGGEGSPNFRKPIALIALPCWLHPSVSFINTIQNIK